VKLFIAILAYALSLFGIDVGSHTRVDRVSSNGTDVLYSRVVAQPTGTRFECVRSASGACYYTVLASDCPAARTGPPCVSRPLQQFALARGESRQVAALPLSRLCVGTRATAPGCD
jgi:hypothetical protein